MNFLIYLIVGGIAGWLASLVMKRDGSQGIILNVVVGIIGGFLVTAFIGAVVLLLIVNLFTRGRAR